MLRRVVGVLNSRLRFKTNGGLFFLFLFLKTSCENLGNKGDFFSKKRSVLWCESGSKLSDHFNKTVFCKGEAG